MVQCRVAYRKSRSSGLLDFTSTREGRIARRSNSEPFAMKLNKLSSYLRNAGADSVTLCATAVEWRLRIVSLSRFSGGNTRDSVTRNPCVRRELLIFLTSWLLFTYLSVYR